MANGLLNSPELKAPARNRLLGWLADAAGGVYDYAQQPDPTMPMGKANPVLSLLADAVPFQPAVNVLNDWSYGQAPIRGTGMTTRLTPDATELALMALPFPKTSAKTVAAIGSAGMVPGLDTAMFIGAKAKTWDAAAAARALEMERAQAAPRSIWSETGTFRGPDGLLRQEIDDSAAKVRDYNYTPQQAFKSAQLQAMITGQDVATTSAMTPYANKTKNQLLAEYKRTGGEIADAAMAGDRDKALQFSADRAGLDDLFGAMRNRPYGPMSAYLSHGDLGAAYPDVYRLHTRITDDISPSLGEYVRGTQHTGEQIRLAKKPQWSGDKTIPLHELQHAIQAREGFARGGSPEGLAQEYGQARSRLHFLEQEPEFQLANQELNGIWDSVFTKGTMSEAEAVAKEAELLKKYPTLGEQQSLMNVMRNSSEDGYSAYKRLAGEAEARATQARMNMTPVERRATFPLDSYDVPINQLIIR